VLRLGPLRAVYDNRMLGEPNLNHTAPTEGARTSTTLATDNHFTLRSLMVPRMEVTTETMITSHPQSIPDAAARN
jgi:hypothetical protein